MYIPTNYKNDYVQDYLCHHGIKGQRWGIRRWQNEDGSLTPEGERHYYNSDGSYTHAGKRYATKRAKKDVNRMLNRSRDYEDEYDKTDIGRKKRSAYMNAIKKYDRISDPDDRTEAEFLRIQKDYLDGQTRHVAERMLKEYGREKMSNYLDVGTLGYGKANGIYSDDEIIKRYMKRFADSHNY